MKKNYEKPQTVVVDLKLGRPVLLTYSTNDHTEVDDGSELD